MGKEYRNYAFDLYGTLVDIHTEEDDPALWDRLAWVFRLKGAVYTPEELREAYGRLCREAQREKDAELWMRQIPGPGEPELFHVWEALGKVRGVSFDAQEVRDIACVFRALSMRHLRLFPGAAEMLKKLRKMGKRVFLLSNAQVDFTMPELKCLGLEQLFDGILLSGAAGVRKPSPAFYRKLLRDYRLDPAETLMVGNDDICDCHGAANVGLDSLYIHTAQSPERVKPLPENCREIETISQVAEYEP